jgi:hypothetical protein
VQPEARLVRQLVAHLSARPDARARKVHGSPYGAAGEPDLDACVAGRAVKVEVKRPGGKATALQRHVLDEWARAGAVTGVVTSVADLDALLDAAGLGDGKGPARVPADRA